MNVSSVLTKHYENVRLHRRRKNKPNLSRRSLWRSRIKPNFKGKKKLKQLAKWLEQQIHFHHASSLCL